MVRPLRIEYPGAFYHITSRGKEEKLSEHVSQYCCRKYSGKNLKEIGTLFGIGESAINQASRLLVSMITNDEKLRKKIEKIQNKLRMSRV